MATPSKFHKAFVPLLFLVCFFFPANSAFQSVKAETADVAGSATTVFVKVSKSVVIVEALSPDGRAQGSGVVYENETFAIGKADLDELGSFVVTNAHVVKNASRVSVLQGGARYQADVEYVDDEFDLAFLYAHGVLFPICPPSSGSQLKVGEKVFAVGSPLGLENTISEGIISGKRELNGVLHLQTTAPISKGSSGGGLFDAKGRFVGITRGKLAGGENLNFAVDAGRVSEVEVARASSSLLRRAARGHFSAAQMAIINSDTLTEWLLKTCDENGEKLSAKIWRRYQEAHHSTKADSPARSAALDKLRGERLPIVARFLSDQTGRTANSQNAPEEKEQEVAKARKTDQEQYNRAANELSARDWFEKGLALTKFGKYQDAIEAYSKAIELDPEFPGAYHSRGHAYYKLGSYSREIKDYDKAIELDPKFAEAYYDRGVAYYAQGNYSQAIKDCDKAIELNPKKAEAYVNRGSAYYQLGEYSRAIEDFNKAIQFTPKDERAYYNRGLAQDKLGNFSRAIEDFNKAIEINPELVGAYCHRGDASSKLGNYNRAIKDYNKAIELNPKFAEAYNNRGDAYGKLGDLRQAIRDYSRAMELNPKDAFTYFARGTAYSELGDHRQAIRDCDKAIELIPEFALPYYYRGLAYANLGDYRQAIRDYDKAIELAPKDARAYSGRGSAYGNLGDYRKAIRDFDRAIELNPKVVLAYYNRGVAYGKLGDYRQEIRDTKTAAQLGYEPAQDYLRAKGISW